MQQAYLGQIMHHGEVGRTMKHAQLGLMKQDENLFGSLFLL